jgi:LytR cell envelope-related transcriptional attenuator
MASLPLALSVHNLVSSVGADAGFAAVIGLAILALLYFAHARETANLRDEAAMLAQRLQDAEARLDAARRAAAAQPQPEVAPAPAAVLPGAQIPFAPAGVAAPELASATRFIPAIAAPAAAPALAGTVAAASSITVSRVAGPAPPAPATPRVPGTAEESSEEAQPSAPEPSAPVPADPVPAQAASAPPAPVQPAPPAPVQPPARPPAPAPAAVTAFRTAPATVAGAASSAQPREEAANGASAAPVGVIEQPPPAAAPPPSQPPPVAPSPRSQGPIVPPERNVFVSTRTRQGPPIGRRFAALVGVLVVVAAVAGVVIATSSTGTQNPSDGSGSAPAHSAPAFNPSLVTVAVLNGTNTNQLAHHVADRLAALGYQEGSIATASNQTLTSTIVGYQPGAANRTAALHIAKALKLPTGSVAPVGQAARTVACPPPSICPANVIVTVGADLAAAY